MSRNLFSRYIWLIDTIRRHRQLTREELNELWVKSPYSDGAPMPRRTFYNYRNAIEELFKINIECNPATFEYYIDDGGDPQKESVTEWLLNAATMSNALTDARDVSDRIFLEDVPSSRYHLSSVLTATKEFKPIEFTYSNYMRSMPSRNVVVEPYFLKLFKQRWYMTGRNVKEDTIKTYALDRMSDVTLHNTIFAIPEDFDAEAYFRDSYGIVFSKGDVKNVTLKVSARQAKYFRALPLHHTQKEMINDTYSIFTYKLKLTPDFVEELLSHGAQLTVLDPPELRAMMISDLENSLENYRRND